MVADGSVGFGTGVISFPIRLNFGVQSFGSVVGFPTLRLCLEPVPRFDLGAL